MTKKHRKAIVILGLVTLLVLVLAGCTPLTPSPEPQATLTATAPAPAPTKALPAATLAPTETPRPLPPPRLAYRSPGAGEQQQPGAPIELAFDQTMDQASVEAAFALTLDGSGMAAVEGGFDWSSDQILIFLPDGDLELDQRYAVTIAEGARNAEGTPLAEPVHFMFGTVGHLSVGQVIPAPGSEEVDPSAPVTVAFDRPVVPLTAIGSQEALPDPLTFIPPVRGEGEWLNTSIYFFRPESGFLPATRYKARVASGLTGTSGTALEQDYAWEFNTQRPAVVEVEPRDEAKYAGSSEPVSISFNQPMDHASVQQRFYLLVDSEAVEGTFGWSGGDTPQSQETMTFAPDEPLARGTDFKAVVGAGSRGRTGELAMPKDVVWRFATVREPDVLLSSPLDGEEGVRPGRSLRITFASPMRREGFMEHLAIIPEPTKVYTYWSEADTELTLYFPQKPVTRYRVLLDGETPDRYGASFGEAARIRFTTGDLSPYALLNTNGRLGSFGAYTDTVAYASYRNVSRLDLALYRLDSETFMDLNVDWEAWEDFEPDERDLVQRWSQVTEGERNEVGQSHFTLTGTDGEALSPGLYYVQLTAPEAQELSGYRPSTMMFTLSRLNLVLKQTLSEAMVWATDLASGAPEADLPVTFHNESGVAAQASATDGQGLARADVSEVDSLWDPFFAIVSEPGEQDFSIAYNAWDSGISPWSFDLDSEFWSSEYLGYLYTDRPIYRPDQTVHFKGIVRADDDARYSLPSEIKALQVSVTDPQGKELYKEELPLNEMGTLNSEMELDAQAALGSYHVEIQDEEHGLYAGTSFQVAEYRKPEYQISVTTDKDAYLSGEKIRVSAEAAYYFGGPVAGADVHWSVLSSDYWFRYDCAGGGSCPWYSWTDHYRSSDDGGEFYGSAGRLIAEGDTQTDERGQVVFEVPADISQEAQSRRFTIEVSITDVNGQQVSSRVGTLVHKGEFYIGVAPEGYLAKAGEDKSVDLLTVDWDGEAMPGVDLAVTFLEHRWYSVKKEADDGGFYWEWVSRDTPVLTSTTTTDDSGRAVVSFTPEKTGSYRVRATGQDNHDSELGSSAYFWVWGGGPASWRRESTNRIDLIADRDEYEVGEVAEILIPSPYSGTVQALVTVERGHVMETEVRELETNSEVLRIPIGEEQVPNVFVSVVIVQGSEAAADRLATFKMGVVKLPVSAATKELKISLTADKELEAGEHYSPRQTATYELAVTDHSDQPVEAEFSLRLADLAVLALVDERGPTQMESFWRDRGLGVRTSMPLVVSMERFNRELKAGRKGGGGGGEGDGLVRSRFADTAFWDPVVRTDAEGTAQVQVTLPDNLTTWRMQARGITADTRVGRAEVDALSTLELLVRPLLPRFFVVGDEAEIATIVHNNTDEALEIEVGISTEGLDLHGEAPAGIQTVQIPAGDKAKVAWPVKALPGEQAAVRMWATSGDLYDGREDLLPIYHYSTPEIVSTAGLLPEAELVQEIVELPRALDPALGGLKVEVAGSLTAASQEALDYLEHYPYECVEQTVSRFLPNVVSYQALDEMGIQRPEQRQKLSQMVGVGLQRLYAQQHYDGGWGWWVSDESDANLTAYVLQGFLEAYRGGFLVDEKVLAKAAGLIQERLPAVSQVESYQDANRLAYELYVLADYKSILGERATGELGLAIRLFEKRHLLSNYGRATLAVALSLLEPEEPARVQTLLNDLAGDAVISATTTHWQESEVDYWNMNTDIRSTAIALWALSRLEPDHTLLPSVARWLMTARQDGYWESTQATAWSLLGLVEFMRASGEFDADYSYQVSLNGEELASDAMSAENLDESRTLFVEIARLLAEGEFDENRLVIERTPAGPDQTGEGHLYYSAELQYYLPAGEVQALDRGIIVARQFSPVDQPGTYIDSAEVGDVVQVKLSIIAPDDLHYVVVEDPLPAGFEGVDLSLKTTSVVGERPTLRNVTAKEEDDWVRRYGWGWWWFSHSEMRDEKVVLFAQYLPRGTYEYTYLMRASVPGEFSVIPTSAYQMYAPEVFGRSDGARFTVAGAD